MAALATPRNTPELPSGLLRPTLAASTVIYAGALVALNASGYAVPAADAANLRVIGRAEETVDNSTGSAGAKSITVKRGVFGFDNDGTNAVGIAHIGKVVYVADDNTVQSATGTNSVKAGVAVLIEDGQVYVDTTLAPAV
jgi:hypothetical protein